VTARREGKRTAAGGEARGSFGGKAGARPSVSAKPKRMTGPKGPRARSRLHLNLRHGAGPFGAPRAASTVPAFPAPHRGGQDRSVSAYTVALEKELHKRISRHYSRLRRRAHAARIYKVKTGLCPGKAPKDPRSWLLYGFHPFRERQRLERTGRAINQRLHDGTFRPLPVLERVIRKTGGGTRSVTVLSVRDAAASRWLYDRLMKRYGWMLSSYAFAYRRDRNHREAVLYLYRTLQKHKRIWTVECDFASFFDSIDHAYLRHVLRDDLQVTPNELKLVDAFLLCPRARTIEDYQAGNFFIPDKGIPQGTTLSLFLANAVAIALDHDLERHAVAFVRYADDLCVFCSSRDDARRCLRLIKKHAQRIGTSLNKKKSPGVHRVSRVPLAEDDLGHVDYLGARITFDGVGIAEVSIGRIKSRISQRLYERLLSYPLRGLQNPKRLAPFDRDLLGAISLIRLITYGRGVGEDDVRAGNVGGRPVPRRPLRHLAWIDGSGVEQLRGLDGWLVSAFQRIHAARRTALMKLGIKTPAITRTQLLLGTWAPPSVQAKARIPSFWLAHAYARRVRVRRNHDAVDYSVTRGARAIEGARAQDGDRVVRGAGGPVRHAAA
jgi:RNA-directed DNA polymerase